VLLKYYVGLKELVLIAGELNIVSDIFCFVLHIIILINAKIAGKAERREIFIH
jgi:hypothetical protein